MNDSKIRSRLKAQLTKFCCELCELRRAGRVTHPCLPEVTQAGCRGAGSQDRDGRRRRGGLFLPGIG